MHQTEGPIPLDPVRFPTGGERKTFLSEFAFSPAKTTVHEEGCQKCVEVIIDTKLSFLVFSLSLVYSRCRREELNTSVAMFEYETTEVIEGSTLHALRYTPVPSNILKKQRGPLQSLLLPLMSLTVYFVVILPRRERRFLQA